MHCAARKCMGGWRPIRAGNLLARARSNDSGRMQCRAALERVTHPLATDQRVELATEAVQAASMACMAVQRQLQGAKIVTKDDDSPVTVADYAAQAIITWFLQRSCQGRLQLVAEEDSAELRAADGAQMLTAITQLVNDTLRQACAGAQRQSEEDVLALIDLGDSQAGPSGVHWVLDPIDGTRGFANGRQYAVCLGMLENGVVQLGVLACPNVPLHRPVVQADAEPAADAGQTKEDVGALYAAVRGCGAFAGPLQAAGLPSTQVHAADVPDLKDAIFMESYESRHSDHSISRRVAEDLGFWQAPLRMDSQAKYGLLAGGQGHLFQRFPHDGYREKIWDHAAGTLIFEEAGGVISDAAGQPLDFAQGRYLDGLYKGIVAATPELHKRVVEVVARTVA